MGGCLDEVWGWRARSGPLRGAGAVQPEEGRGSLNRGAGQPKQRGGGGAALKEGERPRCCGLLLCLRARTSYIVREGENGLDHAHRGRYGLGGYLVHRARVRAGVADPSPHTCEGGGRCRGVQEASGRAGGGCVRAGPASARLAHPNRGRSHTSSPTSPLVRRPLARPQERAHGSLVDWPQDRG